ncbi:hypothetical protein [uncultured Phycicoccus sp.]|uniref:AMIN-like domain-containing (lipo)protein n=1 Tax=uncultured Phycicoccus sp. TaxID=661422 RepID=UPI002602B3B6|nr:hypothetical protein [uncultured Phycicoccus sp.]
MTTPPRTRRRGAGLALAVAVAVAVSSACATTSEKPVSTSGSASSDGPPTSAPASSTSAPASPSASPSITSVPDGFSTDEQRSPTWPRLGPSIGSGTAVRVGRHSAYDRVVYEFAGRGKPTFRVAYVDETLDPVTGEPVDVAGDAFLSVSVTTVMVPDEGDEQPADASAASLDGTVIAAAPAIWGGFEGYGEEFIGVRGGQRPFRVSVLTEPTRLVIDVAK